jgi:peroxiredoxin (alkyl hydroperoxide reductase subunit C)
LDALINYENNGEVCPANWKAGAKAMKPTQEGLENYFAVK